VPWHPGSIVQALLNAVHVSPGRPALLFGDRTWTYQDLVDGAAAWAGGLRRWGLRPEWIQPEKRRKVAHYDVFGPAAEALIARLKG